MYRKTKKGNDNYFTCHSTATWFKPIFLSRTGEYGDRKSYKR